MAWSVAGQECSGKHFSKLILCFCCQGTLKYQRFRKKSKAADLTQAIPHLKIHHHRFVPGEGQHFQQFPRLLLMRCKCHAPHFLPTVQFCLLFRHQSGRMSGLACFQALRQFIKQKNNQVQINENGQNEIVKGREGRQRRKEEPLSSRSFMCTHAHPK